MQYTDLQLLAQDPSVVKENGQKLLRFTLTVVGLLEEPIKRELDLKALREKRDKAIATEATLKEAKELGKLLAEVLLPAKIFNLVDKQISLAQQRGEGIRIRLILSGSELKNVPWEFVLFNRGGGEDKASDFLCLVPNVSLVRYTATPLPASRLEATLPVKVTVAAASPEKWPPLKVSQEVELIKKALENTQVNVSTVENLKRNGLPDKTKPAHIFHFAGHGKFDRQQSAQPGAYEGKSFLILEDQYEKPDEFDAELLAVQLRDAGVVLAVLGACQSAERDDVREWSSIAEALLKAELGAVVGMQFPVRDDSATSFAEHFYSALSIGLSVDEAVSAGRVAVATLGDARGWANPALYLRAPDGVIFPKIAKEPQLEAARQQAVVNIRQNYKIVSGQLSGPVIGTIGLGANVNIEQIGEEVKPGGVVDGPKIDRIG